MLWYGAGAARGQDSRFLTWVTFLLLNGCWSPLLNLRFQLLFPVGGAPHGAWRPLNPPVCYDMLGIIRHLLCCMVNMGLCMG